MPSTDSPLARWYDSMAERVLGPMIPSMGPGEWPNMASFFCTAAMSAQVMHSGRVKSREPRLASAKLVSVAISSNRSTDST